MSFAFSSVRVRLTLWHAAVLAVIIVALSVATRLLVRTSLIAQMDRQLQRQMRTVTHLLGNTEEMRDLEEHGPVPYFEVMDRGQVTHRTRAWARGQLSAWVPPDPDGIWSVRTPADRSFRVMARLERRRNHPYQVLVAAELEPVSQSIHALGVTLMVALPVGLALSVLGGFFLAGRALSPIDAMVSKASQINAEQLSQRLPVQNPRDELGRLAMVLNRSLDSLQESFERLRQFTADASHELRTPLTAIRSVGEVGLQGGNDAQALRDVIGSMLEEVNRLAILVDNLLMLTRVDSAVSLRAVRLDLSGLAADVIAFLEVLAEEKGQPIDVSLQPELWVTADPEFLRQAMINLIDNAVKYTPERGRIQVRTYLRDPDHAAMEVTDAGPGIPPEHQAKVFERFYRIDKGRGGSGGAGLGLAIARRAVEINGGTLDLVQSSSEGSMFRILLSLDRVASV